MLVKYIAKRSINSDDSHSADTEYTLEVKLQSFDRERKVTANDVVSLSGFRQRTYQRSDEIRRVKTVPLKGADARNIREFLDSVEDGESFEFDEGDGFVNQYLEGKGYTEQRAIETGTPANDYFVFGWTQRAR